MCGRASGSASITVGRVIRTGLLAALASAGCDTITGPEADGNWLTHGSPPTALPALETIPFDALGGRGRLVFGRIFVSGLSGIYVVDAATRASWGFSGEAYEFPSVSPDGQEIAFATLSRYSPATPDYGYDLFSVDAQGANLRRLSGNDWFDRSPSWTPDGTRIMYYVPRGLTTDVYWRPRSGVAELKERVALDLSCVELEGPVSVATNGRLAFSALACLDSTSPVQGHGIFVADADGSHVVRLVGRELIAPLSRRYTAPAWSPDGSEIAFLELGWDATRMQPTETRVRIMSADGGNFRTLAELPINRTVPSGNIAGGNAYSLAWSPDGSRIAFNHHLEPLVANIYVVRTDGTGLTRITTAAAIDRSVSWSH